MVVTVITSRDAELTGQAQHLTKQLTDVQHELDRVSVAEQVVPQLLAEPEPAEAGFRRAAQSPEPGQVA
ncbi:hypothetical protein ABGB18_47780 [Nonomuraea sp. B12E4]|uniref:hypothetical protein n=1 Tax=Nonomuraea sp. B12E4 TaxID=3153564 RepID=UPI00325ED550